MTKKRRNNGRSKKNRGQERRTRCDGCGGRPPKDKAIKRFQVKNIVETAALRDIKDASCYKEYTIPKTYYKFNYCVSCAIHRRIVRPRSCEERRNRAPPVRVRRQEPGQKKD